MQANRQTFPSGQLRRHPGEIPFYIFCVILNLSVAVAVIIFSDQITTLAQETKSALGMLVGDYIWLGGYGILGLIPLIIILREVRRASVRANAILLSREQYPDIYAMMENFAERIGLMKRFGKKKRKGLELFLQNGNGVLNASSAQASWKGYITMNSELFSDLYANDRDGLAFILGHELGHIRLWHTNILYMLSVCYVGQFAVIGNTLSRLREMSSDHYGAALSPRGVNGLLILSAGRHNYQYVNLLEFLQQAPTQQSWFVWLVQLIVADHPFMVYRIPRLYRLGLFEPPSVVSQPAPVVP